MTDGVCSIGAPAHASLLEPLGNHCLAGGVNVSRADLPTRLAVRGIDRPRVVVPHRTETGTRGCVDRRGNREKGQEPKRGTGSCSPFSAHFRGEKTAAANGKTVRLVVAPGIIGKDDGSREGTDVSSGPAGVLRRIDQLWNRAPSPGCRTPSCWRDSPPSNEVMRSRPSRP